jgi:outer membrane protein TolC
MGEHGTNSVPSHFSGVDQPAPDIVWKTAAPSAPLPRGAWWQAFADPQLNRLEKLATTSNQDVAGALARFDQASLISK